MLYLTAHGNPFKKCVSVSVVCVCVYVFGMFGYCKKYKNGVSVWFLKIQPNPGILGNQGRMIK